MFTATHRVYDPPRPVWVQLGEVFHPRPARQDGVPMRTRAYGIDLTTDSPGELLGWYQLMLGGWWGLVRFTVTSRNTHLHLELTQLVPAHALRLRMADDAEWSPDV